VIMKKFLDTKTVLGFLVGFLYAFFLQKYPLGGIILMILFCTLYSFRDFFSVRKKLSGVPRKYRKAIRLAMAMNDLLDRRNRRCVDTRVVKRDRLVLCIVRDDSGTRREVHYYDTENTKDLNFVSWTIYWLNKKMPNEWFLKEVPELQILLESQAQID
jgi:hypothetical protein